jgi:hypothetical protein
MSFFPSLFTFNIGDTISTLFTSIVNTIANAFLNLGSFVINSIINIINFIITTIANFVNTLVQGIVTFFQSVIITPIINFIESLANRFVDRIDLLLAYWLTVPVIFNMPKELSKAQGIHDLPRIFGKMLVAPVTGWLGGQIIKALLFRKTTTTLPKPSVTLPSQITQQQTSTITPPAPPQTSTSGVLFSFPAKILSSLLVGRQIVKSVIQASITANLKTVSKQILTASITSSVKSFLTPKTLAQIRSLVKQFVPALRQPARITTSVHQFVPALRQPARITTSVHQFVPALRQPANITTSVHQFVPAVRIQARIQAPHTPS